MNATATSLDAILPFLHEDLAQVERALRDGMNSVAPMIPQVGEHSFASGGKRIRPVLVLLCARLCGYRGPRAIQIAAASEYLHTASLMHDDVVDGADVRRGQPSVNARFGTRLAVLVGDFLYARTCQTLVDDGDLAILGIFAESIRSMAEGEVLQLARSFDLDMTEAIYLDVIARKTATLLGTSCEAGAILGGVTVAERRALREYGMGLGHAFQLVDDALDYDASGEEIGKAPLTDLAEGKITLPLLLALKRCTVAERDAIATALKSFRMGSLTGGEPDPEELALVADAVRRHRGVESTIEAAAQRSADARARIAPFVDGEAKRALFAIADFVVRRRS